MKKKNLGNTGYLHILNRPKPKNILQHQMWKRSFFLILGDVFQDEWHLFLLLRLGGKGNLDMKFSLWSQFCSSVTFLFELSLNRCRIINRNPQRDSQRRKCDVFQWGWGGKKRIFQYKRQYNTMSKVEYYLSKSEIH